jgi:hypothetical protein
MVHNKEDSTLEITLKMFADDLEVALLAYDQEDTLWRGQPDRDVLANGVEPYLEEQFAVWINRQKRLVRFLGMELDVDVLWCFMEIADVVDLQSVRVFNAVIMDHYDDQVNLVHLESDGEIRSIQLQKDNSSGTLISQP